MTGKKIYVCSECGVESLKWLGKCPSCESWNTLIEEEKEKPSKAPSWAKNSGSEDGKVFNINDIDTQKDARINAPGKELNRVLGGGIVPGSLVLLGGEPGVGKSTLMLQTALRLNSKVLYVSGEESLRQIKMRANRIGIFNNQCFLLSATAVEDVMKTIKKEKPDLVIIDSIQTLYSKLIDSTPGSITQLRECTNYCMMYAKESHVPIFLIGHITKDGQLAGPKILEHMVDVVLSFEGDRNNDFRLLRALKNRFGSVAEIGIYEMASHGLKEVNNPSKVLVGQRTEPTSGVALSASIEGIRPIIAETQALVSTAVYGTPQRNANGMEIKRLNMLLAVLEKKCGFQLAAKDVFVNLAGGLRTSDPATDLAFAMAVLSSYFDIEIPEKTVFIGEIGLSGEIRPGVREDARFAECQKLGYETVVCAYKPKRETNKYNFELITASKINELSARFFT